MVKNTKGGKNSKRMGRKFVNAPRSNKLRTADPNEPAELYACVSKCLGNGMAHVTNINGNNIILVTSMEDLKSEEILTLKNRLDNLSIKLFSIFLLT